MESYYRKYFYFFLTPGFKQLTPIRAASIYVNSPLRDAKNCPGFLQQKFYCPWLNAALS